MDWFRVAEMEPGVHLVAEPGHVFSWLIHGSERTILLDTGLGVADIAAAVAPVARTPVEVVTSHGHFDHIGGNDRFAVRSSHPLTATAHDAAAVERERRAYVALAAGMPASFAALREADRDWGLIGPDEIVRPWPPPGIGADGEGWAIDVLAPTATLDEGDVIDLGDRRLSVLHTPGHAPDHICLLDEQNGILFAQDQAYYGPHLVYDPECSVADWARSAQRLADDLASAVRQVYVAHTLRPAVPPRHLRELAEAGAAVLAGAPLVPARACSASPCSRSNAATSRCSCRPTSRRPCENPLRRRSRSSHTAPKSMRR